MMDILSDPIPGLMNDWEIGGTQNKWVCPSDRHLHLRAQLKSGWCVRTSDVRSPTTARQSGGISEMEKEHIKEVLARAEESKIREQQRVGKMIDRLEKMKSRAMGNGIAQCYLCATDFGLLAPKSYAAMCSHCRKYVCQKNCGVETYDCTRRENIFLCKICSEYREVMWKKSGAWFYKEIPEFVTPTEDQELRSPPLYANNRIAGMSSNTNSNSWHKNRHQTALEQPVGAPAKTILQRARITPSWVREKVQSSLSVDSDESGASTSEDDGQTENMSGKCEALGGAPQVRRSRMQKRPSPLAPKINRIAVGSKSRITDTEESGESRHSTPSLSPRHSPSSLGDDMSQNQSSIAASDAKSIDSGVVPSDFSSTNTNARLTILRASADVLAPSDEYGGGNVSPATMQAGSVGSLNDGVGTKRISSPQIGRIRIPPCKVPISKSEAFDQPHPFVDSVKTEECKKLLVRSSEQLEQQQHQPTGQTFYGSHTQLTHATTSTVLAVSFPSRLNETPVTPPIPPRSPQFSQLLPLQQQQETEVVRNIADDALSFRHSNLAKLRQQLAASNSTNFKIETSKSSVSVVSLPEQNTPSQPAMVFQDEPSTSSAESPPDRDNMLGSIQFALCYVPEEMKLMIRLISAENLRAMDKNGFSDPYVKFHLIPGASKATKITSKTIEKTLNPKWNEEFVYYGVSDEDRHKKTLRLLVLDRDRIGSDFLGETRVPLKKVPLNAEKLFNLCLEHAMPVDKADESDERGKICLGLMYNIQQGSLYVTVKRCAELIGMDSTGFSDPYVKISLLPLINKSHRQKTSTKKRTLNPEFNETLTFVVPFKDLPKKTLQVAVYDKDVGKHDDFIGSILLSTSAKGERQKHWQDCIQNPGNFIEQWHKLKLSD